VAALHSLTAAVIAAAMVATAAAIAMTTMGAAVSFPARSPVP
jgi:hypothetical protein